MSISERESPKDKHPTVHLRTPTGDPIVKLVLLVWMLVIMLFYLLIFAGSLVERLVGHLEILDSIRTLLLQFFTAGYVF